MQYEFKEFPKFITVNGENFIVNDENEEKEVMDNGTIYDEDEDRKRLITLAKIKDITIDRRWKINKIKQVISDAGFDPEFNPFF